MNRETFQGVIVVGAGLAGLSTALAAQRSRKVLMLCAGPLGGECASAWAQGGLAAALGDDDRPELHAADTLAAGAGLCDPAAVAILTREAPAAVRRLAGIGAPFDRDARGGFAQSLEAAHGRARVARVGGDGAGRAIMSAVIRAVTVAGDIEVREGWRVRSLLRDIRGGVRGVLADGPRGWVEICADATVLATGGLGGLYAVTTNPRTAMGEGVALAALAGAEILDPEFVQFHPTAMDIAGDPAPLATEALRGEGARLVNADGAAFMERYDRSGDLGARDVVARAIEAERRAGRGAFLDGRAAPGADFPVRFPAVFAACAAAGLDPRRDLIPVLPAAHYHMGGVAADPAGRTSLAGLFAAGECAATGVHGANRLASNSLVEAVVWGERAGLAAARATPSRGAILSSAPPAPDLPQSVLTDLRRRMTLCAGVVRDAASLTSLADWLARARAAHGPALPLMAADLVVQGALARRESRGAHFRSDYPQSAAAAVHTRAGSPAADPCARRVA